MPGKLLTGNFTRAFRRRVKAAVKLQIASAWLTESDALIALLERKALCDLQAIIGISGNVTSPDGLSSLARGFGWESVRLADEGRLFHPKLVLFHYRRKRTLAWIGSANFTGNGMCVNTELMLEIDDEKTVEKMKDWFDREWESRPPDAKMLFEEYRKRYGLPHRHEGEPPSNERPIKLVFHSNGKGAKGYKGVCRVLTPIGRPNEKFDYDSHVDAVEKVVSSLTQGWQDSIMLERIEREGYRINGKPLLSSQEDGTYEKPSGGARGQKPRSVRGWWICHDTSSEQKQDFIRSVADICEVDVEWDDKSTRGF